MEEESYLIDNLEIYTEDRHIKDMCIKKPSSAYCMKPRMNKFLYEKYSSSQNYYYSKEINSILGGNRTPAAFIYADVLNYIEEENLLKRIYGIGEYPKRIDMLTEYYKYHEDVPRLFMKPLASIVHRYYDKKRRLNYIKITKMLKEQNPDMTDSKQMTDLNINDTSSKMSFENEETIPKSLYKLLPDDMSPRKSKDLNETSGRRDKMISSVTVQDLNGVLEGIFKRSKRGVEKYKGEARVLKFSDIDSDLSLSFKPADVQQHSAKYKFGADLDIKNFSINKKLFSSNLVNEYISKASQAHHLIDNKNRATKSKKSKKQLQINDQPANAFKKKKKESIQDFKELKLSLLKNEDFMNKIANKNFDLKNNKLKSSNVKFTINPERIKHNKEDVKQKMRSLNINNFNINININGTNKSNHISKGRSTGPLVIDIPKHKPAVKVNIDSPDFSIGKQRQNKIEQNWECKGKSINFAKFRKWNASCDNNAYTLNIDKNNDVTELPKKARRMEDLISINQYRKSLKNKPSYGACYLSKQSNNLQTLKVSGLLGQGEIINNTKKKVKSVNSKKNDNKRSSNIKSKEKPVGNNLKEPKASFRKRTTNQNKLQLQNPIKLFMSQDFKECRNKSAAVAKKPQKTAKSTKVVKKNASPREKNKKTSKNVPDNTSGSKNKYSTFGASFKAKGEDNVSNPQFNTVTFINLFNKKKSIQGTTAKTNIENSIKGYLIRKI